MEAQEISRILKQKGKRRGTITKTIEQLEEIDYSTLFPTLRLVFLENKLMKNWTEYKVLISIEKYLSTSESLSYTLNKLSDFIKYLRKENIGIQEIDTSQPDKYFFLLYIIEEV